MSDVASILADVRSLANRGAHHAIVARYGGLDDTPEEETWNSTELLYEIGRAFGMLGNEEKVERYLLRCAELAPRRAAVFHCAIGWYFQRKKKWTKALRWYDRALASFPTYHLCLFRRGYCLEKLHRPRETVDAISRAREIWDKAPTEQRQRGRGVQVQVLFHLSRALRDLGEFDAAADALDACCALDEGSDPPAIRPEHMLANRGELNLRRGDLEAAATAFREARSPAAARAGSRKACAWPRISVRSSDGHRTRTGTSSSSCVSILVRRTLPHAPQHSRRPRKAISRRHHRTPHCPQRSPCSATQQWAQHATIATTASSTAFFQRRGSDFCVTATGNPSSFTSRSARMEPTASATAPASPSSSGTTPRRGSRRRKWFGASPEAAWRRANAPLWIAKRSDARYPRSRRVFGHKSTKNLVILRRRGGLRKWRTA